MTNRRKFIAILRCVVFAGVAASPLVAHSQQHDSEQPTSILPQSAHPPFLYNRSKRLIYCRPVMTIATPPPHRLSVEDIRAMVEHDPVSISIIEIVIDEEAWPLFSEFSSLTEIYIDESNFNDEALGQLSNCDSLESISLSRLPITDAALDILEENETLIRFQWRSVDFSPEGELRALELFPGSRREW